MNKYEAMFIVRPDISEQERATLFTQLQDAVTKLKGVVEEGAVWAERRKFYFPIKKQHEGVYYLLKFTLPPLAVKDLRRAYDLNEGVMRVLVSRLD